jgi:hypothetical protein
MRRIGGSFWTPERDNRLQRLEGAGLSAAKIGEQLGVTRNAVLGRSARLRGVVYPCIVRREKESRVQAAVRRRERERRSYAALMVMRKAIATGVAREITIAAAMKAGATYEAVGNELGLSRQRVHQIASGG